MRRLAMSSNKTPGATLHGLAAATRDIAERTAWAPPPPPPFNANQEGSHHDQLDRSARGNEQFARTYNPATLGIPAQPVVIVTCLHHRVDPAIVLGLQLGDAPVIRNVGGRVTQAVIDDVAHFALLAEQLSGGQGATDTLFEVAVVHHTQCGAGFLADPVFRHKAAEATGLPEPALEASAVADQRATVREDVERLITAPSLPPKVSVPGHVYDIATGRLTTIVDAGKPLTVLEKQSSRCSERPSASGGRTQT
jgi:carbonic anhydrase